MVEEYISKLKNENEDKLHGLELEMKELLSELTSSQRLLEQLQRDKRSDASIFSPRVIDPFADEKIKQIQIEIKQLNQKIDYVSHMIEECVKRNDEIQKLQEKAKEELQKSAHDKNDQGVTAPIIQETKEASGEKNDVRETLKEHNQKSVYLPGFELEHSAGLGGEEQKTSENGKEDKAETSQISESNVRETEKDRASELNGEETEKGQASETDVSSASDMNGTEQQLLKLDELLSFLDEMYKTTEKCIALLNGNKNRCRTELKNMKAAINNYARKIEKKEK